MEFLILLTCLLAGSLALPDLNTQEWITFKNQYRKAYKDQAEELLRLKIYLQNKVLVAAHNAKFSSGKETYEVRLNQFADMLVVESTARRNAPEPPKHRQLKLTFPNIFKSLPKTVDWRLKGAVTPVKNQGDCESSWAFGAVGALEGQLAIKQGKLIPLSTQNMIDCIKENAGCKSGSPLVAFDSIKRRGGVQTEADYPYNGKQNACRFNAAKAIKIKGVFSIQENEGNFINALANVGPIAVMIDTKNSLFRFYHRGIFSSPNCSTGKGDLSALAVGYGTEGKTNFWIVKNSFGQEWGENGYFRMARNGQNLCGIASYASYPLL